MLMADFCPFVHLGWTVMLGFTCSKCSYVLPITWSCVSMVMCIYLPMMLKTSFHSFSWHCLYYSNVIRSKMFFWFSSVLGSFWRGTELCNWWKIFYCFDCLILLCSFDWILVDCYLLFLIFECLKASYV